MKVLNHLIVAATAVVALNVTLFTQAGEPRTMAKSSRASSLLASPRYLEEHPELLRGQATEGETSPFKTNHSARHTENIALASSPRFREEHPELRWTMAAGGQLMARNGAEKARLGKFAQVKALAASPRFREEHPEFSRGEPVFEVAPLM